ncbi:MAG: succinylglutamate desuccinylase/aspartoacylase family protein [Acidobacteriota bacterium]|nr:succinylglutamate desuccinylase/aspartoacylase family protein [Acidobacteriota bacterium]
MDRPTPPLAGPGRAGVRSRLVDRRRGAEPGATLVVTAGVHGNEPAGIEALERVFGTIEARGLEVRGEFVGLRGNLPALARGERFVDRDLNRLWPLDGGQLPRAPGPGDPVEQGECRALMEQILAIEERARGPVYFLDLHTSSADGCPFFTCGDTLRNRRFALRFPAPVILGIEEQLDGSLLEYMNERGHITLGVEGGQHDKASSVVHHEATLWIALVEAGLLEAARVPDLAGWRRTLERAGAGVPRVMEVRYRHAIRPGDGFRMEAGFRNFQQVRAGQLLATARGEEIRARESGLVLLPLYQGLGEDGFFLGRRISRGWLVLSAVMRRLRLDRLVGLLPGVEPHASRPGAYRVHTSVARWFPLELFHLLGYRKLRWKKNVLLVSRRPA